MKKNILLGILSNDPYNEKGEFLKQLRLNGFSSYSVTDKVKEIGKYLLKSNKEIESKEIIDSIRDKGYKINHLYWVNLILSSILDGQNKVIITDINEKDLYDEYIIPVVSDPILVPNMKFIRFPSSLVNPLEIKRWIENIE